MFDFKSFTENLGATLNSLTPKITLAFAAAAWIVFYIHTHGIMALPSSVVVCALVVGVLCTCLGVGGLLACAWSAGLGLRKRIASNFYQYHDKKRIEAELEFLTSEEREILAHLLAKKQRMIEVLPDGEKAATLIAKGFLVYPSRRPLAVHRDVLVEVPVHVWHVLIKHQSSFPYDAPERQAHPWRTHWMAR